MKFQIDIPESTASVAWDFDWLTTEDKFHYTIGQPDDLMAVLRGHLFVEVEMGALVLTKKPDADLTKMPYASKLKFVRQHRLIERPHARAIQTLGNLRDSFAHPPIKIKLTTQNEIAAHSALYQWTFSRR